MTLRIEIPGEMRGKGRPRFARTGRGVRTFTDAATASAENLVRVYAGQAHQAPPMEGALAVSIAVYRVPPKSMAKRDLPEAMKGAIRPTTKPDLDNVAKLICDALNGVVWRDDQQIVSLAISKHYAPENRTLILVGAA